MNSQAHHDDDDDDAPLAVILPPSKDHGDDDDAAANPPQQAGIDEDDIPLVFVAAAATTCEDAAAAASTNSNKKPKKSSSKKSKKDAAAAADADGTVVDGVAPDGDAAATSVPKKCSSKKPKKAAVTAIASVDVDADGALVDGADVDASAADGDAADFIAEKKPKAAAAPRAPKKSDGAAASGSNKKITDDATVQAMILDWFAQYRTPVGLQSMVDALGSKVSKVVVAKALDALVLVDDATRKITKKDFKKIQIYFPLVAPQASEAEQQQKAAAAEAERAQMTDEEKQEIEDLKAKIAALGAEIGDLDKSIRAARQALSAKLAETPIQVIEQTHQQLHFEVEKLQAAHAEMQSELEARNSNNSSSSKQQQHFDSGFAALPIEAKVAECERLRRLMIQRKNLTYDVVDCMCGERRPRDCFEEFGLQTEDEMRAAMAEADWMLAHQVLATPPTQR